LLIVSAGRRGRAVGFVVASAAVVAAVGFFSIRAAVALRLGMEEGDVTFVPYGPVAWFAAGARAALFVLHRHHRNRRPRGYADELAEAVREATAGSVLIVLFTFFWRGGARYRTFSYSRFVFVCDWVLAIVGLAAVLVLSKSLLGVMRRRGHDRRAIAILGNSADARHFAATVSAHPETGYEIAAHLTAPHQAGSDVVAELAALAQTRDLAAVMVADRTIEPREISRLVGLSQFSKVDVYAVPELFGLPPTKVGLDAVGTFPVLSLLQDPIRGPRRAMKRALDLVGATVALALLSPLMVTAALAVRLSSPGPILFRQERLGMDGRPFRMLKFRTMYRGASSARHADFVVSLVRASGSPSAPQNGLHKLCSDPRVTPVGSVLRRLSIDELPQLFNVLRGDMSLVGPRPSLPYEAAAYDDWHRRRLDVRPGMTGLWQVSGRSKLSYDEMVKLDLAYIETWGPLDDLRILFRTLPAVLRRESG
jgi:exopolysaccharide biosynthesis polyprenyl glycosylphosphotransferase